MKVAETRLVRIRNGYSLVVVELAGETGYEHVVRRKTDGIVENSKYRRTTCT